MQSPVARTKAIKERAGEKLKDMDHDDLGKSGFWIAQLFVVIATVIGVYLAAHAGLKQAIIFDSLASQESSYYLRKSLHDELLDNVATLRAYASDTLSRNPPQSELVNNRPVLSRYVWDTMRYSPHTLEVPSGFLTGARRFGHEADAIIRKAEGRVYGAAFAATQMNQLLDRVEERLLPGLRKNYQSLARELAEQGIDVTVLKETE
ncbi:hypothetical protein [Marinobacter sp.]|uniref:hypothetical protein n=1 Tax=Marinobacter sp. TaxID=50741 RepID=UPI003568A159